MTRYFLGFRLFFVIAMTVAAITELLHLFTPDQLFLQFVVSGLAGIAVAGVARIAHIV